MASVKKYFGNIIRSSKISISKFKTSGVFNSKDNYIQRLSELWPLDGVWCAFKSSITPSSNTYMSGPVTLLRNILTASGFSLRRSLNLGVTVPAALDLNFALCSAAALS